VGANFTSEHLYPVYVRFEGHLRFSWHLRDIALGVNLNERRMSSELRSSWVVGLAVGLFLVLFSLNNLWNACL
jgi:hypothetical protein